MVDDHDRLFNYLTARTSSRESASLALVGLASSSSLVFLGLISIKNNFYWEFFFIGILFPSLGFAYNEITNRGIHKDDQKVINNLIKSTDENAWKEIEKVIINTKSRRTRMILMRFAFLSPTLGWLLTLPIQFELNTADKIFLDIIFGIIIFGISLIITYTNKIKY